MIRKIILTFFFIFFTVKSAFSEHYHGSRVHEHALPKTGINHSHNGGIIGSPENQQASEGDCSPNFNFSNGSSANITVNCEQGDEKSEIPRALIEQKINGDWEFTYDVYRSINERGFLKKENTTRKIVYRINLDGEIITGRGIGKDNRNTCSDTVFNGLLVGKKIKLKFKNTGSCCPNAVSHFDGEIIDNTDSMVGKSYPNGAAPENCESWWANVSALKL